MPEPGKAEAPGPEVSAASGGGAAVVPSAPLSELGRGLNADATRDSTTADAAAQSRSCCCWSELVGASEATMPRGSWLRTVESSDRVTHPVPERSSTSNRKCSCASCDPRQQIASPASHASRVTPSPPPSRRKQSNSRSPRKPGSGKTRRNVERSMLSLGTLRPARP